MGTWGSPSLIDPRGNSATTEQRLLHTHSHNVSSRGFPWAGADKTVSQTSWRGKIGEERKQPANNPAIPPGCRKAVKAFNTKNPTMSLMTMIKRGNILLKNVTVGGKGD